MIGVQNNHLKMMMMVGIKKRSPKSNDTCDGGGKKIKSICYTGYLRVQKTAWEREYNVA